MKIKVLVVEDEAIAAELMRIELQKAGYEVVGPVASGNKAITIAKEKNPQVILMDINLLGKIDGISAAKEILTFLTTNIIFLSGYAEKELKDRAMELNPVEFLIKPVEFYKILQILEKIDFE